MKRALISAAITAAAVTTSAAPAWAASGPSDTVQPGRTAYQVVPGDSFWSVSQHYGVTMSDLADWNHMDLASPLDAGWTLQIPPAGWHGATQSLSGGNNYSGHGDASNAPARHTYTASSYTGATSYTSYSPSGVWACIAAHESGGNPATDTGNGYYGMYQFTLGSWYAAGGTGNPAAASAAEQTAVAERVQQQQGWGAWPVTSRECGA